MKLRIEEWGGFGGDDEEYGDACVEVGWLALLPKQDCNVLFASPGTSPNGGDECVRPAHTLSGPEQCGRNWLAPKVESRRENSAAVLDNPAELLWFRSS